MNQHSRWRNFEGNKIIFNLLLKLIIRFWKLWDLLRVFIVENVIIMYFLHLVKLHTLYHFKRHVHWISFCIRILVCSLITFQYSFMNLFDQNTAILCCIKFNFVKQLIISSVLLFMNNSLYHLCYWINSIPIARLFPQ